MKKFGFILAVAVLFVACGGNDKKPKAEMSTAGTLNGHEWVDLGLSVKWATYNVGATSPEDYGSYYAWGETSTNGSYTNSKTDGKKMSDISGSKEYDAATANWGKGWRMPTVEEFDEILNKDNCIWTWTNRNGVNGYEVKSKKNGNSIFLPAADLYMNGSKCGSGFCGCYWSSTPCDTDSAYDLYFEYLDDGIRCTGESSRGCWLSVRPVAE